MRRGLTLALPFPPSVNAMWRSFKGRAILSKAGREYREKVKQAFIKAIYPQPHPPLAGRLRVSVVAYPPDKRRRDLDNLFKGPLDAMAHAGVYVDDSQIDSLSIVRGEVDKKTPRLVVELVEAA
jgi:crossover junction endodeoxyribonuclease RusA